MGPTYKNELIKTMELVSKHDKVIFLGQEAYHFYGTMVNVPKEKIIEMPIMEDAQLGMSIGLALEGYVPISMYTRMDFFLLAFNQLINHWDKICDMSDGQFKPRVIIRLVVGETTPLHPGPQHTQDFTRLLVDNLKNIDVVRLDSKYDIIPAYEKALLSEKSTILIEVRDLYNS